MSFDNVIIRYCDSLVKEQEKLNKSKISCETTEEGIELDYDQYSIDMCCKLSCMIKKQFVAEVFKYVVNSLYGELEREKPNVVDNYLQECRETLVITRNKSRQELINLDKEFIGVSILNHHTNYFAKCYSKVWKDSKELPFDDVTRLSAIIKDRVDSILSDIKRFCISSIAIFQLGFLRQHEEDSNAPSNIKVCM